MTSSLTCRYVCPQCGMSDPDNSPTALHYQLAALHRAQLLHHWVQHGHDGLPQRAGVTVDNVVEVRHLVLLCWLHDHPPFIYPCGRCTTRGGTPPSRQTPATTPSWGGCRRPWRTATSCSCSTPTRGPAQVSTAHSAALSNTPDPGPGPTRRAVLEPVLAAAGDKLGVVVVTRRPEDTAGAVLSVFADPDTVITQVQE